MTQERPEIILRGLRRTENGSGQTQARGAAPELRPSPEAAETRPGHGEPSAASVSAAHSPTVKDHSSYHQERSERQSPLTRGMGGDRNEWHGQSAAAPVLTAVPPGGRMGEARRSRCLRALPSRRGAGSNGLAAQPFAGAVRRRRGFSRCPDRSAGGGADRPTFDGCCPQPLGKRGAMGRRMTAARGASGVCLIKEHAKERGGGNTVAMRERGRSA